VSQTPRQSAFDVPFPVRKSSLRARNKRKHFTALSLLTVRENRYHHTDGARLTQGLGRFIGSASGREDIVNQNHGSSVYVGLASHGEGAAQVVTTAYRGLLHLTGRVADSNQHARWAGNAESCRKRPGQ
jgi:hypothetical protein